MKYFFFLLFLPSLAFADSNTTGNQKFLLPSTGVVDATRNWGDKINENFRIADSSLTNVQTAITSIQTDTTTVFTNLQSTSVQLSNYITANNTSTSTLRTDFTNFQSTVANLTASTGTHFTNLQSTAVQLSNLQMAFSTMAVSGASTGMALFNLIVTTHTNLNLVISSADFVNIMGAEYVNVSTYASLDRQGAGGIDAGSEIAAEWYGFFYISNAAGTQIGCVLSTSPRPSPMPSGYTKWRLITYVKNTGSNLLGFIQLGNRVSYYARQAVLETGTPSTTFVKLFSNLLISSGATAATFQVIAIEAAGTDCTIVLRSVGAEVNSLFGSAMGGATTNRTDTHLTTEVMGNEGRDFWYKTNATIDELYIYVTSYEVRQR